MKRALLVLSLACFTIAMVICWFLGWVAIFTTLLFGGLAALSIMLLRRSKSARWWIVIILAVFSINMLITSMSALTVKRNQDRIAKYTSYEPRIDPDETPVPTVTPEPTEKPEIVDEHTDDVQEEDTVKEVSQPVKIVERRVEVPGETKVVTKEVEKKVEVPVEVEKVVTEYVEVPVVEYIEKEPSTQEPTNSEKEPDPTPAPTQKFNYTGDPTGGGGYGYTGDPTGGYGYTGDPTGNNYNSYGSVRISGPTSVTQGNSYVYTISGTNSISLSRLNLPANVTAEKTGTNKIRLYFRDGYTGSYSIGYGSSVINVKVNA